MSDGFEAFWLPAARPDAEKRGIEAGTLTCRYPSPGQELLASTIERLRDSRDALVARPVDGIVAAIDAAAARFADPDDLIRTQALRLLPAATGYSDAMARLVLDRMVEDWRADRLRALLEAELGDPAVLDAFTDAGDGRRIRAYGPRLAFHVFAGNVPGVAVTSLIRSLLVKAPTFGKTGAREPVLPVLFARALASVDPALGDALAITHWPGGSEDAEARLLDAADLVVVYGGEEAVRSIRARAPAGRRVVVHGPRFSAVLIGRQALDAPDVTARSLARAVATFDQHGCVSPHAVWVEDPEGGRAEPFARAVADALDTLEDELPRGVVSPGEASLIQQERGAAEMRAHGGAVVRVLAGAGTRWTVVYDDDPAFRPSCLNRFVRIHPVRSLDTALERLAPVGETLQSVAVAGVGDELDRLAGRLAEIGATRVTTLDRLPWPPPQWHHDGHGPLSELLRWVDLES